MQKHKARMSEEQKKILESIEEQLQQLTIVSETATCNPRNGAIRDMHPVVSLKIPNEFYVLSDRKTAWKGCWAPVFLNT